MPAQPDDPPRVDAAEVLNTILDGYNRVMGVRFVRAAPEEVVAELTIGAEHRQPYGVVHGGVHASLIETVASAGAALHALPRGQAVLGLENHTSFLRAVRAGTLRATGRPLASGRTTHVWEVTVADDTGRPVATGRVRLLAVAGDAALAGGSMVIDPPGAR